MQKEDSIIKVTECTGSTIQDVAYVSSGLVERTTKSEKTVTEKIYTKSDVRIQGLPCRRCFGVIPPRVHKPMLTTKRPVWDGAKNIYKEIKNMDYTEILFKYHTNTSVIWLILTCQKLLNFNVGSKEQPDINTIVIDPKKIAGKTSAQIYGAYKILKDEGVLMRTAPHHYLVNPSFLLPYEAEDYHKAAEMWFKHTGEQLVK